MRTRQLGKNGPEVSVIGLGAWPIGGGMGHVDEKVAIDTVRTAIDAGVTLLDTAQAYRSSESTLGKALEDGYRDRCFLATKVSGDYSAGGIRAAMDASLKALAVDYVDLYQVHNWRGADYPIESTMEAMSQLQQQGKTRYLGVSNFNATQMDAAYNVEPFHSSQPQYNMIDRGIESHDLPYCEQRGIGNLAHSPLAKGLLTGKYRADHVFADDDERSGLPRFQGDAFVAYVSLSQKLAEIADQRGCTIVQLAIAWCLRQPAVACVLAGAKSPAQVADYVPAVDIDLTAEEIRRIDQILSNTPPTEADL